MKVRIAGIMSFLMVCVYAQGASITERIALKPGEKHELTEKEKKEGKLVYFTDDGTYAVVVTLKQRRTIERILKPHTWADEDYRKVIDEKFIRRHIGGCGECDSGECTYNARCKACSVDAELFKEVMHDFVGKSVEILFTALNLRRNI